MNCKQGDLAIIVNSRNSKNIGKIVTCLELDLSTHTPYGYRWLDSPRWKVGIKIISNLGHLIDSVADCNLRPLRDNDGEDEMIRIAGKPEKATQ